MRRLLEFADKYDMLPCGSSVICALSGGADSVCLLAVLCSIASSREIKLSAAHFNHKLRGAESDRDEEFSRALCARLGVPFYRGSGDVAAYASAHKIGTEEAARKLRYAFFEEIAAKIPNSRVATAHNADDNAETLLLNLARGSGLRGMGGIPPVRGIYIRPLLCMTRADILSYLSENGLEHIEDSTNAGDDYARNRLRHSAMPALRSVNENCAQLMLECSERAREDEEFLRSLALDTFKPKIGEKSVCLSAARLCEAARPLSSRAVRYAAERFGVKLGAAHVELILSLAASSPSASAPLPGGLAAWRVYDGLYIGFNEPGGSFAAKTLEWGAWTELPELGQKAYFGPIPEKQNARGETFLFKKENICGKIIVRPRAEGDRLYLGAQAMGKNLKKLFIDKKIPAAKRPLIPVFADDKGVVAVSGIGKNTRRFPRGGEDCTIILL